MFDVAEVLGWQTDTAGDLLLGQPPALQFESSTPLRNRRAITSREPIGIAGGPPVLRSTRTSAMPTEVPAAELGKVFQARLPTTRSSGPELKLRVVIGSGPALESLRRS